MNGHDRLCVEVRGRRRHDGLLTTAFWFEATIWGDCVVGWRNSTPHDMSVDGLRLSEQRPHGVDILRIIERPLPVIVPPDNRLVLLPEQLTAMLANGLSGLFPEHPKSPGDLLF